MSRCGDCYAEREELSDICLYCYGYKYNQWCKDNEELLSYHKRCKFLVEEMGFNFLKLEPPVAAQLVEFLKDEDKLKKMLLVLKHPELL